MADNNGDVEQRQEDLDQQEESQQQDEMSGSEQTESDAESNDGDDDEVIITIGEEPPPQEEAEKEAAPQWVKDLRKRERELARENRELKAAHAAKSAPQAQTLGAKPTLEDCQFDEDVFEQKLTAWHDKKRAIEAEEAKARQAQEVAQQAYQARVQKYQQGKAELKVSDFDDAEAAVADTLSVVQQQIILAGADNPTNLTYALGKNPAKLKELASITDPVQYAFAVAKLETQLKVTQRKSAPPAERRIVGNAAAVAVNDPKLARLEAEADKTGDRSALIAYKKAMKSKAA